MPQQIDDFRRSFNAKISELADKKGGGSCFLSRGRYTWVANRLVELLDETLKKSSQDYRLLRRYEIFETNVNGEQKRMLKHRGTDLLYVSNKEIFDVIHTEHLSTGHGARDVSKNKMKERYG